MLSFKWLALFTSLALAAVAPIPRGEKHVNKGACCFTLQDSKTGAIVRQGEEGITYLNNPAAPEGWYCLYLSDSRNILWDQDMNACILTGNPDLKPIAQFACNDGTPGFNEWTIKGGNLLAHDNSIGFTSCPNPRGQGSEIWGQKTGDTTGCKPIALKATGFQGTCGNLSK